MEDKIVVIDGVEYVLYSDHVEAVKEADVSGYDAGYEWGYSDGYDVGYEDAKND
jgi:hypothetical protein